MSYHSINADKIKEMLFNDEGYIIEFCEAGIITLGEFSEDFRTHLLNLDMENLRKAGHKVRPGAQMMGARKIVEEYEKAKKLLEDNSDKQVLEAAVNEMEEICSAVQKDLRHLAEEQKF